MYQTKKLSEICVIGPKKSEVSKLDSDTLVSCVPMRDVKEGEKYFLPSESKKLSEVYSGYTYFNNEDVILAKVTPCFENGKSGIARDLENGIGFGSSEFYVFRCNPGVLPEYLYRVISSQKFLKEGADNMSGAVGLQRVTKEFIENYNFPLPPLSTQSKIVAKLDEAFGNIDSQISLLKANIEDVERVRKSAMEESFQSGEYEIKKLGEICEFMGSGFACNKKNEILNGYVHLRTHNIGTDGKLNFDQFVTINPELVDTSRSKIYKGDIIFNNTNSKELVGKTAYVDEDYEYGFSNHLTRLVIKDIFYSKYVSIYVNNLFGKGFFQSLANKWIGQAGVNNTMLKAIKIPLPPLPRQHEIVEHLDQVFAQTAELRSSYQAQIRDLEILRQSLLEEAFAGRLVNED